MEGVGGFYKGLGASLLRVTPACCITFVVYEKVTEILMSPSLNKNISSAM